MLRTTCSVTESVMNWTDRRRAWRTKYLSAYKSGENLELVDVCSFVPGVEEAGGRHQTVPGGAPAAHAGAREDLGVYPGPQRSADMLVGAEPGPPLQIAHDGVLPLARRSCDRVTASSICSAPIGRVGVTRDIRDMSRMSRVTPPVAFHAFFIPCVVYTYLANENHETCTTRTRSGAKRHVRVIAC